jgi:N-acetylmuramoyl-L-alanine amidase
MGLISRRFQVFPRLPHAALALAFALGLLSATLPASAEWFRWGSAVPTATAARIGGNDIRTRFVADLTVAVNFNAYVIADPYRVVIDLQEVSFELPRAIGRSGRGLVKAFRYGLIDAGKSRIVLDTAGPVLIEKAFLVEPEHGEPARIVIDLLPTDEKTFAALQDRQKTSSVADLDPAAPLSFDKDIPEEVPPASAQPQVPRGGDEGREPAPTKAGRYTVVIDPGHGGIDPGATGKNGTTEKAIVLAFAKELEKQLDRKRYQILLTRTGDTFLSLRERVRIARRNQADLFLAIHADVVRGAPVRGATIYTLSETASDAEAQALAEKENSADLFAGVDVAEDNEEIKGILIDLARRETKNHSMVFAKSMVDALKPAIELTNRPMRSAGFLVLKAPDVPSALLELGYLSSHADEKLLNSPAWHAKAARAVARAIDNYFSTRMALRH